MTDVIRFDDSDFQRAINEKKKLLEEGSPVQRFVDSEVLRLMVPYTPMDTVCNSRNSDRQWKDTVQFTLCKIFVLW